ncbi:MAG TPA: hypothetical protein PLZ57_12755 [Pseudobdellovibrionaceae bacterium]|nr:hypothetical protein [Pseudobdellovibrionaceae bacterium]
MSRPHFPAEILRTCSAFIGVAVGLALLVSCSSTPPRVKPPEGSRPEAALPIDSTAPGSRPVDQTQIEADRAALIFNFDGKTTKVTRLLTPGEARRPLYVGPRLIAYSVKPFGASRFQVHAVDLDTKIEKRLSFDAGDAEPLAVMPGLRLVYRTNSEATKSPQAISEAVKRKFRNLEGVAPQLWQLRLGKNSFASVRFDDFAGIADNETRNDEGAAHVAAHADLGGKLALVLERAATAIGPTASSANSPPRERITRYRLGKKGELQRVGNYRVARPDGITANRPIEWMLVSPLGDRVLWSNGAELWWTDDSGAKPTAWAAANVPFFQSATFHPRGDWLIGSGLGPSGDLNLYALHTSGTCLRELTRLIGNEVDPQVSPDGRSLLFVHREAERTDILMAELNIQDAACGAATATTPVSPSAAPAATPPASN